MFPPDLQPNGNGSPPEGDLGQLEQAAMEPEGVGPEVQDMIDELGNAVVKNAEMAAGSQQGEESVKFADAALKCAQAIVALVPYPHPEASQPPAEGTPKGDKQTNNPAKKGD